MLMPQRRWHPSPAGSFVRSSLRTSSVGVLWEHIGNAESQDLWLNDWMHICILTRTPRLLEGTLQSGKLWSKLHFESVGLGKDPGLCMYDRLPDSEPTDHAVSSWYESLSQPSLYMGIDLGKGCQKVWVTSFHFQRFHWNGLNSQHRISKIS